MRREDTGSHTEADAGRFERNHDDDEPRDREYAETWPPAWFDADLRAESDALWGDVA